MDNAKARTPRTAQRSGVGCRNAPMQAAARKATPAQDRLSLATVCQAQL